MSGRDYPISFATLGMFIIDDFSFMDADGRPTGRTVDPQECRSHFTASLWLIRNLFVDWGRWDVCLHRGPHMVGFQCIPRSE